MDVFNAGRFFDKFVIGFGETVAAAEDFNVHDNAFGSRRHSQRGIFDVGRFFAENGAEQALLQGPARSPISG